MANPALSNDPLKSILCRYNFSAYAELQIFCMFWTIMFQALSLSISVFSGPVLLKRGNLIMLNLWGFVGGIYGWAHIIINGQLPDETWQLQKLFWNPKSRGFWDIKWIWGLIKLAALEVMQGLASMIPKQFLELYSIRKVICHDKCDRPYDDS